MNEKDTTLFLKLLHSLYGIQLLGLSSSLSWNLPLTLPRIEGSNPLLNTNTNLTVQNIHEPNKPLIVININNIIKLNSTNYLSWKLQIHATLIGYNLEGFIDGSTPCPPATTTKEGGNSPNPAYQTWIRQDKLIFSALVGSLTAPIKPLITQANTSQQAWAILSNTYAKPSLGLIKLIKNQIKNATKGSKNILSTCNSSRVMPTNLLF